MRQRLGRWLGVALVLIGAGTARPALAQSDNSTGHKKIIVKNLSNYDARWFRPGFFVAANMSRYVPEYSKPYGVSRTPVYLTKMAPGFNAGFITDLHSERLPYLRLRFVPGVAFYTKTVIRRGLGTSGVPAAQRDTTQQIGSTALELPLLIKYVSKRRGNVRLYLVGGIKYGYEVGNKKKDSLPGQLRTQSSDLCIEYGIGADLFYPVFKFGPEIRISHGITDQNAYENTAFNTALGRMRSHTVTFYFNFE